MSDEPWIDFDGDGDGDSYDTVELDDGSTSYVHYDEETGDVDSVAVDYDGDGLMDEMVSDNDGDGVLDTTYIDTDGDGWMDEELAVDESEVDQYTGDESDVAAEEQTDVNFGADLIGQPTSDAGLGDPYHEGIQDFVDPFAAR